MLIQAAAIIVGLGLIAYSGVKMLADKRAAGAPVDPAQLRDRFPGYVIGPSDFETKHGKLHRVNVDGLRVNLSDWTFSNDNGEFYRIAERKNNGVIVFHATPYLARFRQYGQYKLIHYSGYAIAAITVLVIFLSVLVPLLSLAFANANTEPNQVDQWAASVRGFSWASLVLGAFGALFYVSAAIYSELRFVGPQPLKMAADDFGPQVGGAGLGSALGGSTADLGYRPTT